MKKFLHPILIALLVLLGQNAEAQQGQAKRLVIEGIAPVEQETMRAVVQTAGMGIIIENDIESAYQAAISNAQQQAVMRVVRRLLPIDERDLMKPVLEKQIYRNPGDFIANYEEIDRTDSHTYVSVKLRVEIYQEKLASRLEQFDDFKRHLRKPPVGFYILQAGGQGEEVSPAESALMEGFTKENFKGLSHRAIASASNFAESMSREGLRRLGEELGMSLLILGESEESLIPPHPKLGSSFVERLVVLRLKIYYCPTGEIIDVWNGQEQGIGISEAVAATDAHQRVGRKAAKDMIQTLYAKWASKQFALQTYPLVVTNIQYAQSVKLRKQLEKSRSQHTRFYWHPYDADGRRVRAEIETDEPIETLVAQLKHAIHSLLFEAAVLLHGNEIEVTMQSTPEPPSNSRTAAQFDKEVRRALLIGIRQYNDSAIHTLQYPLDDVNELAKVLQKYGSFREVKKLTDSEKPTKENIYSAIQCLRDTTEPQDTVLIYFSGHGLEEGGKYYLLPIDTKSQSLGDTTIELSEFQRALEQIKAKRLILFMDSCHSGGVTVASKGVDFDALPDSFSQSWARFAQSKGRIIFTACTRNERAFEDSKKGHGVFTYFLLEALRGSADSGDGFVTFYEVAEYVTDNVMRWAEQHGQSQTPEAYLSIEGNILLSRKASIN